MSKGHTRWHRTFWVSAVMSVLLAASLAPYMTSPTELVRVRNSLLYEPIPAEASWSPATPPPGYRVEREQPTGLFRSIVLENHLSVPESDWQTALRIGRHLLQGVIAHGGQGGAIQADLSETYERITQRGEGYCGDFVDSFTALATTAGIFSRSWAFSFDGFGGHGHIFNEIWDSQTSAWRMIDVFNNVYVADGHGRPLSALEFRDALLGGHPINWIPVEPAARPGFKYAEKALDYFRRGVHQWYLWWGNNVFEYDRAGIVETMSVASRSLGQLSAIAVGVHPPLRVLPDPENQSMQRRLEFVGAHFLLVLVLLPVLLLLILVSLWNIRAARMTPT